MDSNMRNWKKRIGITIISIVCLLLVVVIGYLGYVFLSYSRIEDQVQLIPDGVATNQKVQRETSYRIVTQNVGFGAYSTDFTFFMDGGHESWAKSPEEVYKNIDLAYETVKLFEPDFVLWQEVDSDSTRSYHINQQELLKERYEGYTSVTANNYHSSYLMYPFYQPHGSSNSGIMTFSKIDITAAERRSLPISTSFSKLLDLDRCYSTARIPVEGGKELILYNVHMSAYGGSDEIRSAQMNMLFQDMKQEYEAGNYCVCGGDFNHDFTGDSAVKLNGDGGAEAFGWAQPFPIDLLPEGLSRCDVYSSGEIEPTCRNCDVPYEAGNYTVIVDGFIVSDNVYVEYLQNYWTGFSYSDHCPVMMQFFII